MSASEGRHGPQSGFVCSDASIPPYRFVVADGTNSTSSKMAVKSATGATIPLLGITYEPTSAPGDIVGINHLCGQIVYLSVDGSSTAIAVNDRLTSNASGQGIKATAATQNVGAVALDTATTAGAVIRVSLTPCAHMVTAS